MKNRNESRKENASDVTRKDTSPDSVPRKATESQKHPHLQPHPTMRSLPPLPYHPTKPYLQIKKQKYSSPNSTTKVTKFAPALPTSCSIRRRIFLVPKTHGWG